MKKQISLLLVLFAFIFSISLKAQTRYDIGLEFAPSMSKIYNKKISNYYQYIYPVNYGIRFAARHNHFIYSTGVMHITQGSMLFLDVSVDPEGGTGKSTFYIRAKSIMIPFNAEYLMISNKKLEFSGGLGLYFGYIYSQQFEDPFAEERQNGGIITLYTPQRFRDINMFNDFYFGINAGISLRVFFNDYLSLLLRPNYLYQIRTKSEHNDLVGTNRLSSLSMEIGLFYSFGSNSRNSKENNANPEIP
jgi:hypothetical protein